MKKSFFKVHAVFFAVFLLLSAGACHGFNEVSNSLSEVGLSQENPAINARIPTERTKHSEKSSNLDESFEIGIVDENLITSRIIRKMVFGNGIEYVAIIEFSPVFTLHTDGGKEIYRRGVSFVGTYFQTKNEDLPKQLSSHTYKVDFTYDKKNFVTVLRPKDDIMGKSKLSSDGKWKIKQNNEILSSDDNSTCTVSIVANLYKIVSPTESVYFENMHVDFMCSKNGQLAIHSNMF
jgi:hypothetical protein